LIAPLIEAQVAERLRPRVIERWLRVYGIQHPSNKRVERMDWTDSVGSMEAFRTAETL
jgi:hypothetical protein